MSDSFVTAGTAASKVVTDLAQRRRNRALANVTAALEKRHPLMKTLREANAEIDRAQARQMIARGVAMIRETEGEHAADEWLTQCMSVSRSVK